MSILSLCRLCYPSRHQLDRTARLKTHGRLSLSMDQVCFFSNSRDVAPGQGVHERVADASVYAELARIPHWRRVLSNFHIAPFEYDGLRWNTIEHAFQAAKLAMVNPELRFQLSMDSNSPMGLGDGIEARKRRKWAILPPDLLTEWNAQSSNVMAAIARAKYAQCSYARQVLLATHPATLVHIEPRTNKRIRFRHLEAIRQDLLTSEPREHPGLMPD